MVPVHNALRSTKNCLRTLRQHAPPWARIVVVNDASDARTTAWLREQPGIVLLENEVNLGFVKTANRGLLHSDAPWVCLLNSDTLMTPGALERMVARCERDPRIGLCCPLSNNAINLSVKIPPGQDVFSFAEQVARTSPALYPDAVTVVGFCLLVKRELIRSVGVFDEAFGRGYGEETDLHYRARSAGFRCVVADDTFVYHRQGASFDDADARMRKNLELVYGRWGETHRLELAAFEKENALGAVRDAATFEWIRPDEAAAPPDVLFVLPMMGVFGGVADILELANALVLDGVRAGVVILGELEREFEMELFFRPARIPPERFLDERPSGEGARRDGVPDGAARRDRRRAPSRNETAYFVQDYEGWFGADGAEYVGIDLRPRPADDGDLRRGSPTRSPRVTRTVPRSSRSAPIRRSSIRAATAPRTGPSGSSRCFAPTRGAESGFSSRRSRRSGHRPDVEIVFFGSHPYPADGPPLPHRHLGILSRDAVARLFSTAHVVVDPSLFQGFGLVGLEGMASGAACALTDSGGVREYAVDGENALVVPTRDHAALAAAILRLVSDPALRERLGAAGVETARRFTWERTSERYRAFLDSLPPAEPIDAARAGRARAARPSSFSAEATARRSLRSELESGAPDARRDLPRRAPFGWRSGGAG